MQETHETKVNIEHETIERWRDQEPAYQDLLRLADESPETVYGLEKLRTAFVIKPTVVACIDERVLSNDPEHPKIGVAGSGILMSKTEFDDFAAELKRHQIKTVTYHGETDAPCGACAAFCNANQALNLSPEQAGQRVAKRLIEATDLVLEPTHAPYNPDASHALHDARAIVVDGTGRFNPAVLGLPKAFQSSVRYYGNHPEYMNKELEVAIGIATGHGFGQLFEVDSRGDAAVQQVKHEPLAIVLVGDESNPEFSTLGLRTKLQATLMKYQQIITVLDLPTQINK